MTRCPNCDGYGGRPDDVCYECGGTGEVMDKQPTGYCMNCRGPVFNGEPMCSDECRQGWGRGIEFQIRSELRREQFNAPPCSDEQGGY